eukprot:CAMPEP_0117482938 /NCGR_PEP_ID=MMETSP0784-20121206/13678_1 /TAXON_ID=39447 /ORGANISM="" /LENGTH=388 /DNA_ID=CAMNT_0005277451 /DNA_START=30 /DNA_END=1196 /DNA_ORIENTATION=-
MYFFEFWRRKKARDAALQEKQKLWFWNPKRKALADEFDRHDLWLLRYTAVRHSGTDLCVSTSGEAFLSDLMHTNLAQHGENTTYIMDTIVKMMRNRADAPLWSLKGFVFEAHHTHTFNEDAIAKGSPYRAEWPGPDSKALSDVNIIDTRSDQIVQQVQMKCGGYQYVKGSLSVDDYEGFLKICNSEHSSKLNDANDRISYKGIESQPATNDEIEESTRRARSGESIFHDASNKTSASTIVGDAALAGLKAGAAGAVIGGVFTACASSCSGSDSKKVGNDAIRGSLQGGTVAAGAAFSNSLVTALSESAPLGTLAGGAVGGALAMGFQMRRCGQDFKDEKKKRGECQIKAGVTGGVGTAATIAGTVLFPPFGGVLLGSATRFGIGMAMK